VPDSHSVQKPLAAAQVDVVIPAYREEEWLPDLLDCLLEQDLSEVHIFVSCSGDEPEDQAFRHLEQYRETGKILFLHADRGVGNARNAGARAGRSNWILFLDADLLLPAFFSIQYGVSSLALPQTL